MRARPGPDESRDDSDPRATRVRIGIPEGSTVPADALDPLSSDEMQRLRQQRKTDEHHEESTVKILGIQRAELVVHDPNAEADKLAALLGMHFSRDVTQAHGVLSRTDFASGLELAGPSREDSVMQDLLEENGEGLLTIVFRVDSCDSVIEMAKANGIEVLVDLDKGDEIPGYRSYRQVSLSSEKFPARASFTFAEYEEA